jgi:PHD/YefM family antitoxin component YafN of YafNO toxin-antitoxin module
MPQAVLQDPSKALEEKIEFSNVTDLRKDFLPRIEEIQKNPALRLLILKHGKPQAVLMSSEAYSVLKKVVDLFLQHASGLSREQAIADAIKRFESERASIPARTGSAAAGAASPKLKVSG